MMNYTNQIDQFILGKLSSSEEEEFRRQLSIDSDLAQEVKKREMILSGLEALGNQKMKDRIKTVRKEMLDQEKNNLPKKGQTRSLFLWMSVAAAIFILGFVSWQFFSSPEMNAEGIFAESYQPYIENFGNRGGETAEDYIQAGTFYKAKKYASAIPLLENILKIEPSNSEVELVLGDCFLSIDKIEKAIFHFKNVLNRKTNLYNDPAQWFLALSYLKQNKIDDSKSMLKVLIENPTADYHKEAKELLSKLIHLKK